ncbi:MAG: glycerophosphoryl diester phosphodiesterase [Acidimicrobiales bacterium]|nr:glycerophosphoryl diester phosphodiesterase [Acidimicrobiales bacterium]
MRRVHLIVAGLAGLALVAGCSSSAGTARSVAPTTPPVATPVPAVTSSPPDTVAATTVSPTTEAVTTDVAGATSTTGTSTTVTSTTGAPATTLTQPTGPLTVQQLLDLGRPIVLAHASGEDQHPHSTPFGYAESVREGVDMLDFDVQLTADGVLVVQHDDTTARTTNEDVAIADTDYADLAALDNAYWFTTDCTCTGQPDAAYLYRGVRTGAVPPPAGYAPDDFIIPRFSDIAEQFPTMPVNIEIKGSGDHAIAAANELAKELTELDLLDNAVVTSFDDSVVDAFHAAAPTVEVTPGLQLSSDFILDGKPLPAGMRILQLPVDYGDIHVLTPETIAASHAAGYVIWVWPDDRKWENPDGYAQLLSMGMDGLNINFPDQGVQAVRDFVAGR